MSAEGYVFAPWVVLCYILTVMKLSRLVVAVFAALAVPVISAQNDAATELPQPVAEPEEAPLNTYAHQEALVNRGIIQLVAGIHDKATADAAAAQMAVYVEISESLSSYREPENWIFSDDVITSTQYDEYAEGAVQARLTLFRAFFYGSKALAEAVAGDEDYATVPTEEQYRIARALVGKMRELSDALEKVKDHDSAVSMAPTVAELNGQINQMMVQLNWPVAVYNWLFDAAGWSRDEDIELGLQKQVLFGCYYYFCPELALALGGRTIDAQPRTRATASQLLQVGKLIEENSRQLTEEFPAVTGGPGLCEEQSWVISTTGQEALVTVEKMLARLLPDATPDSYFTRSDYENTEYKRAYSLLMTMDGKLVTFDIWFDLSAYYAAIK